MDIDTDTDIDIDTSIQFTTLREQIYYKKLAHTIMEAEKAAG